MRPQRTEEQRRAHLRSRLLGVEHVGAVPEAARELRVGFELFELVRLEREQQIARRLVLRVDPEPLEIASERVEVLEPKPLEAVHLLRESRQAVGDPVRQRRHQKAAVAAARTVTATSRLEHDDVARRVQLLGVERRPQPGIPAADDAQVCLGRLAQGRVRTALRQRVEPERSRHGVGIGGSLRGGWAGRSATDRSYPQICTALPPPLHAVIGCGCAVIATGDGGDAMQSKHQSAAGFRPDVEGLRAVAVLLVVLFHCGAWIPGGYVGVDVFFVISGFLITTQLVRELRETGRISLRGFYARRARRILPAATLTTVVTVVVAGLLLPPLAANRVFGDARAAAVFGANIHFAARDANYFSADLPPSPLQHYWSLSVEEQFYFVWPLLLVLSSLVWLGLRRRPAAKASGRKSVARPRFPMVIVILSAVAALSFAGSVLETPQSATVAYYSLAHARVGARRGRTRGAVVARGAPPREARGRGPHVDRGRMHRGGGGGLRQLHPYPGDAALLPVAGAAAIIFAGAAAGRRWGAEAVLGTAPFQRVGAWSYSWYLWHWPVLILAPALLGHSLSKLEALTMAVISLVIAVLCFVLIERPIRRMQTFVRRPSLGLAGGAVLVATSLAAVALAGPVFASLHSAGPPVARPVLVSHGTRSLTAQLVGRPARRGTDEEGPVEPRSVDHGGAGG